MKNSSKPKPEKDDYNRGNAQIDTMSDQLAHPVNLFADPDYRKLLENYQVADFEAALDLLVELEDRYPGHPRLKQFRDDLDMKQSLKTIALADKKQEKRDKIMRIFRLSAFAVVGTLLVLVAFFFSFQYFYNQVSAEEMVEDNTQIISLNNQVEQLLLAGRPQPAAEIIERMQLIDPDYENLPDLVSRTETLLRLEARYEAAKIMLAEGRREEALALFKEIQEEKPGQWGVHQDIEAIESEIRLERYLEEGEAAYQAENWAGVIEAYENAMRLDSSLNDPVMTEQLLKGYLNRIIEMLENDDAAIEEIEQAEQYYRRAVALIPQSRTFARERGNLQEVSRDLLEVKFSQVGRAGLADKEQTPASIAKSVSYIRRAANINPRNTTLQLDLVNAELYQVGFQNIVDMNWGSAISNLSQVVSADRNFADGNASILLYEAYYAFGRQYFNAGFYLDAVNYLEEAELLAWDDSGNRLKLFQVQSLLGNALGRLENYEEAVSYYQYALTAIQVLPRLNQHPDLANRFDRAEFLANNGEYEEAYEAFQQVVEGIDVVYTIVEAEINDGASLALFASENQSTASAILDANDLTRSMLISFGRILRVPTIEN